MRILIPNQITGSRYEKVKKLMHTLGAPVISCLEISDGYYFALEGSHRITASKELGIEPILVIVDRIDGEDGIINPIEVSIRESKGLLIDFDKT